MATASSVTKFVKMSGEVIDCEVPSLCTVHEAASLLTDCLGCGFVRLIKDPLQDRVLEAGEVLPEGVVQVVMYAEIWGSWGRHIQVDRRTAGWGRGWARALVGVPAGKAAKWRAKLSEEAGSGVQVVGVVSDALKFWDDYAVCTDQGYWVAQSDAVWASGKKVDGYEVIFVPGEVVDLELDRRQHTLTVRGSKRHVTIANLPASGMLYPALCFVDPKQYAELLDYYPPAEYFPTEEPAEDVEEVDAQLAAGTAASQAEACLEMPGYKASKTQYSDVSAKKWASKDYQDLTPEKVRDWRRPRIAWKSKAEWDEAKSTWCETSGDQIAWDSGCRKVAGSVEHDPGHVAGGKRLVKLVANLLRDDDIQAKMDAEGFVSIQCLLKAKPVLNEYGTAKSIVTAIEEQARHVRLDKARRRVRLENLHEEVRAEASAFMRQQPFGVVPIVSFLSMPVLVRTLPETASREGLLRQALAHPDSELEVQGTFVSWRPRASKLRQVVEQLFDDTQESRLQVKLAQSATGEIPLAWIVGKYADRFGFSGLQDARVAEAVAEELAKALEDSKALVVDRRRLTIRARQRNPEVAPEDHDDVAGNRAFTRLALPQDPEDLGHPASRSSRGSH
ncbi:unnamed protein product [Symbiodinium natans]|uniref:Uncharacterized protein n=1 Tax=Symbiodinium natans TaxID=878477 RepID=A0A812SJ39_9DINO|nr:unnamed protein product [Symbiodinium natans]